MLASVGRKQKTNLPPACAAPYLEQNYNDARKVDVAHDHDVELAEQLQLAQVDRRLAVRAGRLLEVPDRPDDREQDGATAQQIDQHENVPPGTVLLVALVALGNDDLGHVSQHLQRNDDHEQLLVLVRQYVLDERPTGADQHDRDD